MNFYDDTFKCLIFEFISCKDLVNEFLNPSFYDQLRTFFKR